MIEKSKKYFSEKKEQIDKINGYLKSINKHLHETPETSLFYVNKLIIYYNRLMADNSAVDKVKIWANTTSPDKIKEQINYLIDKKRLSNYIKTLSASAKLSTFYSEYSGKDSFEPLIQKRLDALEDDFKVKSIPANNNPIVIVRNDEDKFIIRILRMNKKEEQEDQQCSPRILREQLSDIQGLPAPYLIEKVEDDGLEITYLEYGEYYADGNLEELFDDLRKQKEDGEISDKEFEETLLHYAKKIVQFYSAINEQDTWFTDLKPSNFLLDKNKTLVLSDIKGLVLSDTPTIESNRTSNSRDYYDSAVFDKNKIKLELLQRQTLAATLYQLACGKLPKQYPVVDNRNTTGTVKSNAYENVYDFNKPVFKTENGRFLENLITRLHSPILMSLNRISTLLDEQLHMNDQISLDDSVELSSMANQDGYYRMK